MKRVKNLWSDFVSFENLFIAAVKARKGKRFKKPVLTFHHDLESNILKLQRKLLDGSYRPGKYYSFEIHEPKKRTIYAAPYIDRVVHHALINIIEPVFEPSFYYHSYACRVGKGMHKAIKTCREYVRKNPYCLKCDVSKYFQSIDHGILKDFIRRKLSDERLLNLIDIIIDFSPITPSEPQYFPGDDLFTPVERRKGIPIGNLTSQFFANLYLNELDTFIKQILRVRYYIRYMDDFLIFHRSKSVLKEYRQSVIHHLQRLRLFMHPSKREIFPVKNGVPFLGFNVYPNIIRLKKENIRRFIRRMKRKRFELYTGKISRAELNASLYAWIGHVNAGNTWKLREDLFGKLVF